MLTAERYHAIQQYLTVAAAKGISTRFALAAFGVVNAALDRRGRVCVTCRQAPKLCGLSRQAIRQACRRGKLPYEMGFGVYSVPHYLIPVASLLAYASHPAYQRRPRRPQGP